MHKLTNNIGLGQIYSGPALALVKVITDNSSAKLERQIASSHGCCLNHLKKSRRLVMGGGRDRLVVEPDRGTWGEGGGSAPLHPRSMHHSLSQEGPRQPAPTLSLPHSKHSPYICQDVFKLIYSSNMGNAFYNLSFRSKMEALHFLAFSLVAPVLENV